MALQPGLSLSLLHLVLNADAISSRRCLFLSFSVAFILRTRLAALNRKKDVALAAMNEKEKQVYEDLGAVRELPDSDPRFRYMA
jgi:hypothetical protein